MFSKKGDSQYLVIDGLQRYTTMLDYSHNPFKYVREDEITDSDAMLIIYSGLRAPEIYEGVTNQNKDVYRHEIRQAIITAIKEGNGSNNLQIAKKARTLILQKSALFTKDDMETLDDTIYKIVERFMQNSSIQDVEIPIIVFSGPEEELAEVYQNLNQQGVKLSKYDIYAATWINHTVTVRSDPDFIKLVIKKYEAAKQASGLEISNFDKEEMLKTGELTVFEYAFGLGKELSEKCPKLFGFKQDDAKIEGISFLILAEIFGLDFLNMGNLANEIVEYKNILDFKKLKDAIVGICKEIEDALNDYITAPTKKKGVYACHADLQLASYIVVLFKLRYSLSVGDGLTNNQSVAKTIKSVKENLYKHYLYDIIRGYWAGAGNTKLEELLSDPKTCRYVGDVPKPAFEQAIQEWLQRGNERTSVSISTEIKLFCNYYLRKVATSSEITPGNFDLEHCVPQNVLKKYLTDKQINVPVNSPCNLVFIPLGDNRSKGDLTYYQNHAKSSTAYALNEEELDKYLYPNHSELSFVEAVETITEENYRRFLKDRVTTITKRMIEKLYK